MTMTTSSRQILGWLLLATAILLPVGCGKKSADRVPVFPVSGKLVDGVTPAKGAILTFCPAKGSRLQPFATVNEDGAFQVSTYVANDGAPEGEYVLTVRWPKNLASEDSPDRLAGRCSNPKKSKWQIRVEPKTNDIGTLDLKTWATGTAKK